MCGRGQYSSSEGGSVDYYDESITYPVIETWHKLVQENSTC